MKKNKSFLDEKFLTRWVSGKITAAERDEFRDWLEKNTGHKEYFDHLQSIWDTTGKIEFEEGSSLEQRWNRISEKIDFKNSNVIQLHFYLTYFPCYQ